MLTPLGLTSRTSVITVLLIDIEITSRCGTEVRVPGLGALATTSYLRRLTVDFRPLEVLQVLISKLTLVLEVPRARLILLHIKES